MYVPATVCLIDSVVSGISTSAVVKHLQATGSVPSTVPFAKLIPTKNNSLVC